MFGSGRIPDAVLADAIGRLAVALAAGIDLRRAWATETERVPRRWRPAMAGVGRALTAGDSLAEALGRVGGFPPLVTALAAVGDRTGHEAEMLRDAAAALRQAVRARAALGRSLVTPALQFSVALAVVGLLILVGGGLRGFDGDALDLVGLGLSGPAGLATFAGAVATAVALIAIGVRQVSRSWADHGLLRRLAAAVPVIGPAARAAEAAAWCRAASLASGVGLDVGALVTLASRVAPGLRIDPREVETRLRDGVSLDRALAMAGLLPRSVIEAVAVGEMTGTTAETLEREAALLEERARHGFTAAVEWIGWLAWAAVAGMVTVVVWRFFAFYVGLIQDAVKI